MQLFSGEDTFASYQAAKEQLAKMTKNNQAEVVILDGDDLKDPSELANHVDSLSLFATPSVVFLKRPFANSQLISYLSDNLDSLNEKDIVLWNDGKADKRTKLVKALEKLGKLNNLDMPKTWDVEKWFSRELLANGIKLSQVQIKYVMQRIGHDKWLLNSLIEKLSLLGASPSEADIAVLTGADAIGDIWKFLDSLGQANKSEVLTELNKLTRFEDSSQYIIAMLTRELGLIAKVLDIQSRGDDFSSLKLHPFVLDKTKAKACKFNWAKVKKLYQALFRLDQAIKEGRLDPVVGLTMFVLSW